MEKALHIFARISKVDEAKREVWGVATAEMVDKDGEIFDYETSKPFFKAWSDEISKATDGKSLGNIREMHEPSAVGKLVAISFDDDLKQIPVGAKIVDDIAWKKCMEGVYTGFSIGGKYEKAWKDGEYVRFTAKPYEISIVDNPCVPGAHFTAVKADGTVQVRKFAAEKPAPVESWQDLAKCLPELSSEQFDAWYEETREAKFGKRGAQHSAATKAHHAAIKEALGKAMGHCDALMEGDKSAQVEVEKQVPAEVESKIETQESNMALEKVELEKLDAAKADSASALSKVAEVEKGVTDLKAEVTKGFNDLGEVLNKMVKAMAGQAGVDTGATVARTAVPQATVTVTKAEENGAPVVAEVPEMSAEEIQKLPASEREKRFALQAKNILRNPTPEHKFPGYAR